MFLSHSGRSRTMGAITAAFLALVSVRQATPPERTEPAFGAALQLAQYTPSHRSRWKDWANDKDADPDMAGWKASRSRVGGRSYGGHSGYDAKRIGRFWSHFEWDTRVPQVKPLERQLNNRTK